MTAGNPTRRRLLMLAAGGSLAVTAGCINTPTSAPMEQNSADGCLDQLDDSVPEEEATALSIDGIERQPPEGLNSKEQAGYACGPQDGMLCGSCTFYIDDKNGDAIGACAVVAGQIRSVDWCGLWQPREGYGGTGSE